MYKNNIEYVEQEYNSHSFYKRTLKDLVGFHIQRVIYKTENEVHKKEVGVGGVKFETFLYMRILKDEKILFF